MMMFCAWFTVYITTTTLCIKGLTLKSTVSQNWIDKLRYFFADFKITNRKSLLMAWIEKIGTAKSQKVTIFAMAKTLQH